MVSWLANHKDQTSNLLEEQHNTEHRLQSLTHYSASFSLYLCPQGISASRNLFSIVSTHWTLELHPY